MLRMNTRELSGLSAEERLERLERLRSVNHHTFEQRHTLASGEVRDVEVHLSLSETLRGVRAIGLARKQGLTEAAPLVEAREASL
jgi:hypothetical protein